MKLRKAIAVKSICLVLLSTLGCSGTEVMKAFPGPLQTGSQLAADSGEECQEFRETVKIRLSGSARARSSDILFDAGQLGSRTVHVSRYNFYLQKYLSAIQSRKLFIDLGALII